MSLLKKILLSFILAGLVLAGGGGTVPPAGRKAVPAYNYHNLIRFHVIANSDTAADQELKRQVRDVVLASVGRTLAGAGDIGAARQLVSYNLAAITAAAEARIRQEDRDYPVQVEFGDFVFPTRAYGDLTLPAGEYEAVRLVIGEGRGENWWCVLFPPLCLVDVTTAGSSILPDNTPPDSLPAVAGLTNPGGKQPGVRIGWKVEELFKSSLHFLAGRWP